MSRDGTPIKWQEILRNSVRANVVKASALRRIPHLMTCEDWQKVTFLGRVRYDLPFCRVDGGLVKLHSRIYFITKGQIDTMARIARFSNLDNTITVVAD